MRVALSQANMTWLKQKVTEDLAGSNAIKERKKKQEERMMFSGLKIEQKINWVKEAHSNSTKKCCLERWIPQDQ